jgi:protein-L-isoaspartate(D-aspartate) O-methyltransferase
MPPDPHAERRRALLAEIEAEVRATAAWTGRASLAPRVMVALAAVARHAFVPAGLERAAYDNHPLPIGHGQTISQPFIVAIMTELLDVAPTHKVLEIGTGSGYQAAVLAELAGQVITIESVPALAETARARLAGLGYGNVQVIFGDGSLGWAGEAPYDRIIVTAAAPHIPAALLDQLGPEGRMLLPLGAERGKQHLTLVTKSASGRVAETRLLPVAFVPLLGAVRH